MEEYIYTEKKIGNYTVKVVQDKDPYNPRECDNLGQMICFHNRYNLGDDHNYDIEECKEIYNDDNYISLPLYLYDHSGITMNTTGFSCPFDSGQIGIIYVKIEDVKKEYDWVRLNPKRHQIIIEKLKQQIEEYDEYLRGDIYGYITRDSEGDEIDSCWNFYGYDFEANCLLKYAKNEIDLYLE